MAAAPKFGPPGGIGQCRDLLTILRPPTPQELADSKDAYRDPQVALVPVEGGVPASVLPLASREFWQAQQTLGAATHEVWLRYYDGLTARHAFDWNGTRLNIKGPPLNPDGRQVWHRCLCTQEA